MKADAEEILTDLILLKSTSDDGVSAIVDYVSGRLKRLGIEPRYCGDKRTPAIIGEFGENGVAMSGHLDTVPRGNGWKRADAEVVDGFVYGRGSCDMKGGCTAMLLAASNLVAANIPFTLCFTSDEETTMVGAKAASGDKAMRNAPAIVVAEPTDFDIVVKEKGLLHLSLLAKGTPAHASMPELGDNAIVRMIKMLGSLEDLQRIPPNPTNEMTLSVTTIKGGTRINVIPGECEAELDIRYPSPMDTNAVLKEIKGKLGRNRYDLRILHELDPVETDPESKAVTTLRDIIGAEARVISVPYATEMVMFKEGNRSLMVCGPGDPRICHSIDERIELAQIAKAVDIYTEYCSRMTGS